MRKLNYRNLANFSQSKNFRGQALKESETEKYHRRLNEERRARETDAFFKEHWWIIPATVIFFLLMAISMGGENSTIDQQRTDDNSSSRATSPRTSEPSVTPERPEQPTTPQAVPTTVSFVVDSAVPGSIVYATLILIGNGPRNYRCRSNDECFQLDRAIQAVGQNERLPVEAAFTYSEYVSQYGVANFELPRKLKSNGVIYEFSGPDFRLSIATSYSPRAKIYPGYDFSSRNSVRIQAP